MASIHRRPRSPHWYGAFRQSGKLVLRSTGSSDKAVARRIADDWERLAQMASAGALIESQTRSVIEGILERAGLSTRGVKPTTVRAFIDSWLAARLAEVSEGSAPSFKQAVAKFYDAMGAKAEMPLGVITPEDSRAFIASLRDANYARATVTKLATILRSAFRQAVADGLIASNPFTAMPRAKRGEGDANQRGTFTATEVRLLIDAAASTSTDWHTVVLVGVYCGARLRDCCRLRWEDVDLTAGTVRIMQLKVGVPIVVPLHHELQGHLEKLASTVGDKAAEYVTPTLAHKEAGGARGLSDLFSRIMRSAGVSSGKKSEGTRRQQSEKSFHSFRHGFISSLANAGVPPELRMKLSGHADLKSHTGYTHHEAKQLADAVGKLSFR